MDSIVSTTTSFVRFAGEGFRREPPLPSDFFGIPTFFLWNVLFILILALIFFWLVRSTRHPPETALEMLKKRYVKGEINKEQFESMKKDLGA